MSITLDKGTTKDRARLARKRRLTALILFFESLTACLWRMIAWLCFFAGLWLLQIPSMFGAVGPGVTLAAFLLGMVWIARMDLRLLRLPHSHDIDRRLESAGGLTHRPLEIIDDQLANMGSPDSRRLWQKQKHLSFSLIAALRLPFPRALLAARDPLALRIAALLLLAVGLVAAGPQWRERIVHGLAPYQIKMPGQSVPYLTLWITPPEYTGSPRITLQGGGKRDEALKIPAGSMLKARINSRLGQPSLTMGNTTIPMTPLDKKSWGAESAIIPGQILRIAQMGIPRATIPYTILPDNPPAVTVAATPRTMEKAELQFDIKVSDDYGVTEMTMAMDIDPVVGEKPLGDAFTETRAVMSAPGAEQELRPLYDLGWHPWAGLPVEITFTVRDHLGQETKSPPVKMTLPERAFKHPVAAMLIDMRKQLAWAPESSASEVSKNLLDLMIRPEGYANDPVVFLSLRTMASRLQYEPTVKSAAEIIAQLWDTAVRIEDGNLPLAARELRTARAQLEKLLADPDATPEEIAQAIDDLRAAMSEYFRELAREMQKRFAQGESVTLPPELFESLMNPEDLANFLDQLQAQALTGDKDAARQMLSQLQQLMDSLDPSLGMDMPPEMAFMQEGVNELQQLIEKQRALLDLTESYFADDPPPSPVPQGTPEFMPFDPGVFKQWGETEMPPAPERAPLPPAGGTVNTEKHQVEQDALRYVLGKLMLDADAQLGEIPESMPLAEQEMRLSAERLGSSEPRLSAPHQEKAIEYLQQSMQQMSQQMAQMLKQMMMMSMGPGKMDPLGRPLQEGRGPSWLPGSQVKIPDEAERKRVQEIQKMLRERAGELERPDYELDYFRRLLKQF